METYLLALQARALQWIGLGWLATGLYLGQDPLTVAWRAAVGAYIGMRIVRWLLNQVAGVVQEQVSAEEAERRMREEAEAAKLEAAKPKDVREAVQQAMGSRAPVGAPA